MLCKMDIISNRGWHNMKYLGYYFLSVYIVLMVLCIGTFMLNFQDGKHYKYSDLINPSHGGDVKFGHYALFIKDHYGLWDEKDIKETKYSLADLGASVKQHGDWTKSGTTAWKPPPEGKTLHYKHWLEKVNTPHGYTFGMTGFVRSKENTNTEYHDSIVDATPWWAYTHGLFKKAGKIEHSYSEINKYNYCWDAVRTIDSLIVLLFLILIVIGFVLLVTRMASANLCGGCGDNDFKKIIFEKGRNKRIDSYMLVLLQIAIVSCFGVWTYLFMAGTFHDDKCYAVVKGPVYTMLWLFYIVLGIGVYGTFAFGQDFVYWGHKAMYDNRFDQITIPDPRASDSWYDKSRQDKNDALNAAENTNVSVEQGQEMGRLVGS